MQDTPGDDITADRAPGDADSEPGYLPGEAPALDPASGTAPDAATATAGVAPVPNTWSAVAGVLAAGLALGVGELASGFSSRVPSLVARVGDVVIDNVPGSIERWAIETFGENDKPALVIGITVICLIIGAATGVAAASRFRAAWLVFGLFALVGASAAAGDPQRSAVAGWIIAFVAAAIGISALWLLLAAARASAPARVGPDSTGSAVEGVTTAGSNRRRFVAAAGAAAAVGVATPVVGSILRQRQNEAVEADREQIAATLGDADAATPGAQTPDESEAATGATTEAETTAEGRTDRVSLDPRDEANFDAVDGVTPIVIPNDEFYRIDTALVVPTIDVDTWSMRVVGMVDQELAFTFDDLLAMDLVEEHVTLSCVSNKVGGDLVGNARWLGVPITSLLEQAGVQPGATQIVGRSVDGWTGGFPTAYLDDPDRVALVAVAMNGEPLPVEHGFPVRLVVAGLYGYVSATKWLKEIELTTLEDFDGYWIPRGWSKLGPIKTQSRIDVPRPNAKIPTGTQPIAGVAWAPDRGVDKVEVQVSRVVGDQAVEGEWMTAELSADITDNSWRQWHLPWTADPGDYMVRVRATDGNGHTQVEERTPVAPDGATGWHTIAIRVE